MRLEALYWFVNWMSHLIKVTVYDTFYPEESEKLLVFYPTNILRYYPATVNVEFVDGSYIYFCYVWLGPQNYFSHNQRYFLIIIGDFSFVNLVLLLIIVDQI